MDGTQLTFDVWRDGEPSGANENCVNVFNFDIWNHNFNDNFCNGYYDFLCEKEPREPADP